MNEEAIDPSTEKLPEETPTEETPTEAVGLSVDDLKVMMQIIQVVGSRGAVKAEEMELVGALYTKLYKFLKSAGAIAEEEKTADLVQE